MPDFREHLRAVRRRPDMYLVRSPSFEVLVAYVQGIGTGASGALLAGFREFLLLRLGAASNLAWPGLVERLAFPDGVPSQRIDEEELVAVTALYDLLDEFLAEILDGHQRLRLYHEYVLWARDQPGYIADLVRFNSSPPGRVVGVDKAAAMLGISRSDVFDLIAAGKLSSARAGAEVFVRNDSIQQLRRRIARLDGPSLSRNGVPSRPRISRTALPWHRLDADCGGDVHVLRTVRHGGAVRLAPRSPLRTCLVVGVALLVCACGAGPVGSSPSVTTRPSPSVLDVHQGMFGIAWTAPDIVIVGYDPDVTVRSRLASVTLSDGTLTPIDPPPQRPCPAIALANPVSIAPGRIALTDICLAEIGSPLPDRTSVLSLDPSAVAYEPLASVGDVPGPAGAIASSPDGTRFLVGMGDLCGVIVEATPDGPKPLTVEVSDGQATFSLADISIAPDCSRRGWASLPTWSSTRDEIAFFAAPQAIGLDGPPRASVPANLYVMAPSDTVATAILKGVTVPRGLRYSPDGGRLAFAGEVGGIAATWVLDRATGQTESVYGRKVDWLDWSSDGKRLVGLQSSTDRPPFDDQIVVLKLPS